MGAGERGREIIGEMGDSQRESWHPNKHITEIKRNAVKATHSKQMQRVQVRANRRETDKGI